MKKFLSILLAIMMIAGLVPTLVLGTSAVADVADSLTAIDTDKNGRVYHYYESFDNKTSVQGASLVMSTLGWTLPLDSNLANDHTANVIATENGVDGVPMYEIKGGRLYLRNHGTANEYVLVCTAEELAAVVQGAYTVEYTVTYLPTSYSTDDGYFALLFGATEQLSTYGEVAVRISGYGHHKATTGNLDAGDVSGSLVSEVSMTSYLVNNIKNPTLYERLCGDVDNVPGTGNGYDLRGTQALVGKQLRVRLNYDGKIAPRVYVNDVLVSDPRNITDGIAAVNAEKAYTDLLAAGGSALGFCVTPGIDCVIDEIVLYDGVSEVAELGDLYITEIATLPDNAKAPYIEIYNAGVDAVSLVDYVLGYNFLDKSGVETTVSVELADYLGKSLNVNGGVIDNPALDVTLAPGEAAVIFLVDANADVAELVNKVGANDFAGFRYEYALSADLVVGVPCGTVTWTDAELGEQTLSNNFRLDAYQYRTWFVGDAYTAAGKKIVWEKLNSEGLALSANVDSMVALAPSIAFGYDLDIADTSFALGNDIDPMRYNFGRNGDVMPGYAAHFIYGADSSTGNNVGLMVSRSYVKIKDEMNVGKLLDIQKSYFDRITDYRAGRYDLTGALSITEFIPHTRQNDAFECFELTNLDALAVNVYEYGLASSGSALYGSLTDWTRGTAFVLNPTADITNPTNVEGAYLLQPGETVVVWNMTVAGYTVDDFRAYYGLDEDVAVIVAASLDATKNVVAANGGTVSYGVAAVADVTAFLNGTAEKVAEVVSDITVPMHSLYYNIDANYCYTWNELSVSNPTIIGAMAAEELDGCLMNGVKVGAGKSLVGYYKQVEVVAPTLTLEDGTILTNYAYTTYKPCLRGEIADGTTVYYAPNNTETFRAYGTKQIIDMPADYAVSFAYGGSAVASKSTGALTASLCVEFYDYNMSGRGYGTLPYLISTPNPFVVTEVSGGATASNTLGTIDREQGITANVYYDENYYDVIHLDENGNFRSQISFNRNTCRDVYVVLADTAESWTVNGTVYAAGTTLIVEGDTVIAPVSASLAAQGAGVRMLSANGSALHFTTGVSKELYDNLVAQHGADNVALKTAIVPAAYVDAAGAATVEALNAHGYLGRYTVVKAEAFADQNYNTYYFAGAIDHIVEASCEYTGIGYVEVNVNGNTVRYYGATSASASLQTVAATALADVSAIPSATYCNEVACGVYSPYTATQLQAMRAIG